MLKTLDQCQFSIFVSYAHADNDGWFDWVERFGQHLEIGLKARLRFPRFPPLHLSGENGPVAGVLSEQLKDRIATSFAMVIAVHENYARSDWCLKELEYFHELFGMEGLRKRLFLLALSEPAVMAMQSNPTWRRLIGDEQVWLPFYDPENTDRPVEFFLAKGVPSPDFLNSFERLRKTLAQQFIEGRGDGSGSKTPVPEPRSPLPPPPPPPAGPTWLFGIARPELQPAVEELMAALAAKGIGCKSLPPNALYDDFAEMVSADALVLPFNTGAPLMPFVPGGHLVVQRDAWLRRGRPAEGLRWLDLRGVPAPVPADAAAQQHIDSLLALALSPQAMLRSVEPPPPPPPSPPPPPTAEGVRIYIESNRNERWQWESIGEQIRSQWEALANQAAPGRVPPLVLRTLGLPVERIDDYPTLSDADGIVLLWGRKTPEALVAQIDKIERKLPGSEMPPCIVAYLTPPQPAEGAPPAWGWQVLRYDATGEDRVGVSSLDEPDLTRFISKVLQHRIRRLKAAAEKVPA